MELDHLLMQNGHVKVPRFCKTVPTEARAEIFRVRGDPQVSLGGMFTYGTGSAGDFVKIQVFAHR